MLHASLMLGLLPALVATIAIPLHLPVVQTDLLDQGQPLVFSRPSPGRVVSAVLDAVRSFEEGDGDRNPHRGHHGHRGGRHHHHHHHHRHHHHHDDDDDDDDDGEGDGSGGDDDDDDEECKRRQQIAQGFLRGPGRLFDNWLKPDRPGPGDSHKTILSDIKADGAFKKLAHLIEERGTLAQVLDGKQELTLFAPVNEAFDGKHDPPPFEVVTQILLYHVVGKKLAEHDLKDGYLLDTALTLPSLKDRPQKIRVFERNNHLTLNYHVKIVADDIKASNGAIQAVDKILLPPPSVMWVIGHLPKELGIFVAALKRTGLIQAVEETPGITVFAPDNAAFKKLGWKRLKYLFSDDGLEEFKKILMFHVSTDLAYGPDIIKDKKATLPTLEGSEIKVVVKGNNKKHRIIEVNDEAHVKVSDMTASNGVIHTVNKVLTLLNEDEASKSTVSTFSADDESFGEVMTLLMEQDGRY